MKNKKFVAVYSVWTGWTWIDNLDGWKKWIYIYENSLEELENIQKWDIICLIITWKKEITLFEYIKKETIKKDWNIRNYIILPGSSKVFKYSDISIWDFKNLYFLNFDKLKSWVRSPLATKKNLLVFKNNNDILEEFKNIEKLKEVFSKIWLYIRKYIVWVYNKNLEKDKTNIYLDYKNNIFLKEYSIFYEEWIKNTLTGKKIKQVLEEVNNKTTLKILNWLLKNDKYVIDSYTWYYDLTRVLWEKDEEDILEEKNISEEENVSDEWSKTKIDAVVKLLKNNWWEAELDYIYSNIERYYDWGKSDNWKDALRWSINREVKSENPKIIRISRWLYALPKYFEDLESEKKKKIEELEQKEKIEEKKERIEVKKEEKEKSINDFIKNKKDELDKKHKRYKIYFTVGISFIIILNIVLLILSIKFNLSKENFIQEFLSKWIYLFSIEFLILYISYFYFNLSNKYLLISEIYNSYMLISDIREWSALEIDDEDFKKENIRKLFGIQNVVETSFKKSNDKMPIIEILDSLLKVKSLNK